MAELGIRIGVDVGGTFTDFVLIDPTASRLYMHKEPSTPKDPAQAVSSGFAAIVRQANVAPGAVQLLAHGTTIGLNAIIQRKGAATSLVVSQGAKDVLELGRCKMRDPLNFFDTKERPLVPRSHVLEVPLRLDARGRPILTPKPSDVRSLARRLRELRLTSAAVAITNAYLAPEIEASFCAELAAQVPEISITSAAAIWPEIREYERTMVGLMNAYIAPLMERYLTSIEAGLAAQGFRGKLLITTSNGGTVSVATARSRPIDTVLSGPAAGVVATARFAEVFEQRNAITVDMGGTSSDMSVVTDADVEYSLRAQVGDFPLFMPVVSVNAIGAGGGSILWVDEFGVLKVGPESAGAFPGPACYGRGGDRATVTDCYVVCGLISTETKLGGQVSLSADLARNALMGVAKQLRFNGPDAAQRTAWAALKVATAKMATELQKGLAMRGIDQQGYALIPFGGAGPTQSAMLAAEARLDRVVIPRSPGTFCALGAVLSDLKRDFSRTIRKTVGGDGAAAKTMTAAGRDLERQASKWLKREADLVVTTEPRLAADMRYAGQSYEIAVDVSKLRQPFADADLTDALHREHEKVYGFADHTSLAEITSLRLTAVGRLEHPDLTTLIPEAPPPVPEAVRAIYLQDRWAEARVYKRSALAPGSSITSPAIVEQKDTTTVIPDGWEAKVDAHGNLVLMREHVARSREKRNLRARSRTTQADLAYVQESDA